MKTQRLRIFLALFLLLFAAPLGAQDNDDFEDFASLDLSALLDAEVSVGSTFSQRQSDIPAIVEVMTAEEIAQLGITNLIELLLAFTGTFESTDSIAPFSGNEVRLRAGTNQGSANRILVLVDQQSRLDELNEVYNPYEIPIAAIERVEFLRGPAAVLYGSGALAGVLRLVLKTPEDNGGGIGGYGDPLGRAGMVAAHGNYVGGNDDTLKMRVDVQAGITEDRKLWLPVDGAGGSGFFPRRATYVNSLLTLHAGDAYVRLRHVSLESRVIGLIEELASRSGDSDSHLFGFETGYTHRWDHWSLTARSSIDYRRRDIDIGRLPTTAVVPGRTVAENQTIFNFDGLLWDTNLSADYSTDDWHLTLGGQYRRLDTVANAFRYQNDGAINALAPPPDFGAVIHDANLLVQSSWHVHKQLSLIAGGRLNIYQPNAENAGFALTPAEASPDATFTPMGRGAVVWRPVERLSIKALYGRAFRLPTMQEMLASIQTVIVPNAGIKPELQDTAELGLDVRIGDDLVVRSNGFFNRVQRSIQVSDAPNQPGNLRYDNDTAYYETWGGETSVKWHPLDWFSLSGSFVFQEGRREDGTYLASLPRIVAGGWATFRPLRDDTLTLTPFVKHRGHMLDVEGDTLLDTTVRWTPLDWLTAHVTAKNILGTELVLPYFVGPTAFETGSRALRIGLTAEF